MDFREADSRMAAPAARMVCMARGDCAARRAGFRIAAFCAVRMAPHQAQAVCGMNLYHRAAAHRIRTARVRFRRSFLLLLRIPPAGRVSAYRRDCRCNRAEEKQILFSADFREIPCRVFYRNSCCK